LCKTAVKISLKKDMRYFNKEACRKTYKITLIVLSIFLLFPGCKKQENIIQNQNRLLVVSNETFYILSQDGNVLKELGAKPQGELWDSHFSLDGREYYFSIVKSGTFTAELFKMDLYTGQTTKLVGEFPGSGWLMFELSPNCKIVILRSTATGTGPYFWEVDLQNGTIENLSHKVKKETDEHLVRSDFLSNKAELLLTTDGKREKFWIFDKGITNKIYSLENFSFPQLICFSSDGTEFTYITSYNKLVKEKWEIKNEKLEEKIFFTKELKMKLFPFSFHGKKIFYVTEPNGELWAMNIDGTEETKICEKEIIKNEDTSYRRISRDDEKLLTKLNEDLWIINTSNNSKECITKEIKDKLGFNIPWEPFSPDGRLVLFYIFYSSSQNNGYYIVDLKTSKLLQLNGSSKLNLTDATWIG